MTYRTFAPLIIMGFFFGACGFFDNDEELTKLIVPENELIPLEIGNYWIYEQWYFERSNKDTVREEIIGNRTIIAEDIIVNAFETTRFRYDKRPSSDAILSLKANGINGHYYLGAWSEMDSIYINNRRFKYPAKVGDTWESRQTLFDTENNEFKKGNIRIIELIDINRTVITSAGIFENCYVYKHLDFNPLFLYDQFIYIKPGIGIIGGETISIDDTLDIAGQYFLREYRID